ncbi:MAG: gliding motility-associated C-terminal domain-containing protein [Pelagibacterales bacterium]|nr:gliding motility-associated C-terminal domain-containing protein [Pelagibacterales bacterium]
MKRLLLLFFFLPFCLFGQECTTITSVLNADSVVICIDSVSCNNDCNGRIEIDVYPQSNLYNYNWDTIAVAGLNVRDSLCAGTYGVTITDAGGLFVMYQDISVDEPSAINIFSIITDPTCYNYSDGSIDVVINGGSSPYSYSWSNGFNSEDIDSIFSGQYTLITTDQHNCKDTTTFLLTNPLEITSTTTADTLSCIGSCDGEVSVSASNGFFPYSILWDDVNSQTNDTAVTLCYGLYTVYITDANGCLDTNTVFVENPDTLKLSRIEIDSACFDICDGEILVNIEGGTSPYNVSWSVLGVVFDTINITIPDLCPDVYEITYTDANSCTEIQQIILTERDSFRVLPSIINDSCFSSCTGQIMVQILNPNSPPFIYNWSDGQQDSIASNLCKDSINIEIVDARGCIDTFYYFVDEPPILSFDTAIIQHNDCYGQSNGSIILNISGGTGLISTQWTASNNYIDTTNQDITNLFADDYTIHIQDQNLCTKDTFYTVSQNDSLQVYTSVDDVDCYGYSDGIINLTILGGTTPYTIVWANIISDSSYVDSLLANSYPFFVSDSLGCSLTDSATINQPDSISVSKTITNVLCHGYHTGSINLSVSGGLPPYTYLWSDSSITQNLLNVGAGNYSVLISDINNCEYNLSGTISEPQFPITPNLVGTNILCNGDATGTIDLTVNGGTPSYTYLWSNAETTEDLNNLTAGTYTVSIVDSNGCDTISQPLTITEPNAISWTSNVSNLLCYNDSSGSIDITISGGITPYTFSWSNGETTEDIPNLDAGSYTVTIMDNNLCVANTTFPITQPQQLNTSISITNIDCFGADNGSVDLTVSGGTPSFSYSWNNGMTTQDINNLIPGNYYVIVTDANNCTDTANALIDQPERISITGVIIDSDCFGEDLGAIDISVFGGVGGYTYSWTNGATIQDINNLFSGNYSVTVTDGNGCEMDAIYFIDEPSAIFSSATLNHILGCYGDATGSIEIEPTGGTSPYNYSWDNNASTQDIGNLIAGDYSVIIRDSLYCEKTFTYTLTQPTQLALDYTVIKATCEENNDGAVYTTVSGGTMPYSYQWSNGEEDKDLLDLSKGVYSLYVEDASGCGLPVETFNIGFDGFDGCIEIPTGFTPNGDGIHDEWAIYGLYNFPNVIVKVFNRWGQQVFESDGYDVPWDGKHNGKDLPIATYYYIIELTDSGKIFDGNITIKR